MPIECYGATRVQEGKSKNEDAFLIEPGRIPFAALCDGAGVAEQAAKKTLGFFHRLFKEETLAQILRDATWARWVKLLDSSLLGSAETTFIAVAIVGDQIVGAYVGDSRSYLIETTGSCRIITASANKFRLGSGEAKAAPIHLTIKHRDVLVLLSDGAWTPLSPYLLQKAALTAALESFSEVPHAILDAAGRTGRPDDMTAVALRITKP